MTFKEYINEAFKGKPYLVLDNKTFGTRIPVAYNIHKDVDKLIKLLYKNEIFLLQNVKTNKQILIPRAGLDKLDISNSNNIKVGRSIFKHIEKITYISNKLDIYDDEKYEGKDYPTKFENDLPLKDYNIVKGYSVNPITKPIIDSSTIDGVYGFYSSGEDGFRNIEIHAQDTTIDTTKGNILFKTQHAKFSIFSVYEPGALERYELRVRDIFPKAYGEKTKVNREKVFIVK